MKSLHILLLSALPAFAATIVWDNGAKLPGGADDPSYHADDNWDSDSVPLDTDDVKILQPALGGLVRLSATTATVNTIQCTVPFQLLETLVVTSSGSFENSLSAGISGRIRANGIVTLKGANTLTDIALDGTAGFINDGTAVFGTRGINSATPFKNNGVVSLLATTSVALGTFENNGTVNLGAGGSIGSATTLTNKGTLRKDNPTSTSEITAHFTQQSGEIHVSAGAELEITGAHQHYEGGTIRSDGSLLLSHSTGSSVSRVMDGLTTITGDGTVIQNREYELRQGLTINMPNAPGYQIGDLKFGKLSPAPIPAALENSGYMTIIGSPQYESVDPAVSSNLFRNASAGTVLQDSSSQPRFKIQVLNDGLWTSYGMTISQFSNSGNLLFEGIDQRIDPAVVNDGGTLTNSGNITFGQSGVASYTIKTKYDQQAGVTTNLKNTIVTLEGGSDNFDGTFELDSSSRLIFKYGTYFSNSDLSFTGSTGSAVFGGSQLSPILTNNNSQEIAYITNSLGKDENNAIDESKGFMMKSGTLEASVLTNIGNFVWSGGDIRTTFQNKCRLEIPAGSQRELEGALNNSSDPAVIIQSGSLVLANASPSEPNSAGGRIINIFGTHRLRPGALISGGGTSAYQNIGTLICEQNANAAISSSFDNRSGEVIVKSGSTLHITNPVNVVDISGTVTLTSGNWEVEEGALLLFNEDIDSIKGGDWKGNGLPKVHSVIGVATRLYRTNPITHSNPLTVSEGAEFKAGSGSNTTLPSCELQTGGRLTGNGTMTCTQGPLNVGSGNIAPGDSPGTLSISGNTLFTADSTYEWEAGSAADSDLLNITGTATLAGTIRPAFLDGYTPGVGTAFTILTAPTVTGTFDFIDHSSLPPGRTVSLAYTPTSVTLTVGSISLPTYESWKSTRFTDSEQADALISGPDADPDGDGHSNLQEYAHGTNPKSSGGSLVKIVAASSTTMNLTFTWATGNEASYSTSTSETLQNFLPTPHSIVSQTTIAPGLEQIVVQTTRPSAGKAFARIKVTSALSYGD